MNRLFRVLMIVLMISMPIMQMAYANRLSQVQKVNVPRLKPKVEIVLSLNG